MLLYIVNIHTGLNKYNGTIVMYTCLTQAKTIKRYVCTHFHMYKALKIRHLQQKLTMQYARDIVK